MSYIQDALDATHPGHDIDVAKVEAWLAENEILVQDDWRGRAKRRDEEYKAEVKAEQQARLDAAPAYTGAITSCMAWRAESRGPGYRCHNKPKWLYRARNSGKVLAVCTRCVKHDPFEYTGWAGNPNPRLDTVEPDEAAKVPQEGEAS